MRVLAEWNIPLTDPRVGKMNHARWMMAYYTMVYKNRRDLRRFGRFFGNDMTAYQKDEEGNPVETDVPDIFPLAGILNPETYHELTEKYEQTVSENEIEVSQFEKQAQDLEKKGLITDIDVVSFELEKKLKDKQEPDLSCIGVTVDKTK